MLNYRQRFESVLFICVNVLTSARRVILHNCPIFLSRYFAAWYPHCENRGIDHREFLYGFVHTPCVCHTGVGFAGSFASLRVSGYLLRSNNDVLRDIYKTFRSLLLSLFFFFAVMSKSEIIAAKKRTTPEIILQCQVYFYILIFNETDMRKLTIS